MPALQINSGTAAQTCRFKAFSISICASTRRSRFLAASMRLRAADFHSVACCSASGSVPTYAAASQRDQLAERAASFGVLQRRQPSTSNSTLKVLVKVDTPRFLGSVHDPQGTPGAPQSQEYGPFQGMARCIWQTQPVPMQRAHFMVEGVHPGLRITRTQITEPGCKGQEQHKKGC